MIKGDRWDDHYARRARDEKWLARSVYKLKEIDRRFKLIRQGYRLLDLGCYPGSWSQYCIKRIGPKGEVVGMDLKSPDRFSACSLHCRALITLLPGSEVGLMLGSCSLYAAATVCILIDGST